MLTRGGHRRASAVWSREPSRARMRAACVEDDGRRRV